MKATDELIARMTEWIERLTLKGVDVDIDTDPVNDPYPDYTVVWDATLCPKSLRKAYLNVYFSDDGGVGYIVEKRGRIAERLGLRCLEEFSQIGGYGTEPFCNPDADALVTLCTAISRGQLRGRAYRLGRYLVSAWVEPTIELPEQSGNKLGSSAINDCLAFCGILHRIDLTYDAWDE